VIFLPTLTLLILLVGRFGASRHQGQIARATMTGTSIGFVGSVIYLFASPARHGAGYVISSIGVAIVGAAVLATMWFGSTRSGERGGATLRGLGTGKRLTTAVSVSPAGGKTD
jgi:hypothetical protein